MPGKKCNQLGKNNKYLERIEWNYGFGCSKLKNTDQGIVLDFNLNVFEFKWNIYLNNK